MHMCSLSNFLKSGVGILSTPCYVVQLQQTIGQQQQVTMLQNEIDKLRSDNVKLYEKVRYLQSAGYSHKV